MNSSNIAELPTVGSNLNNQEKVNGGLFTFFEDEHAAYRNKNCEFYTNVEKKF